MGTALTIGPVERAHAKLSASGSKKWLTCTPSAHLEDQFPDEGSDFAAEGTFAHEIFELQLLNYLDRGGRQEYNRRLRQAQQQTL